MKTYSVLLVEDDETTRAHLARVIDTHPQLTLVGVAENVAQGHARLRETEPDVLLCDLGLPDGNGIELIEAIRHHRFKTEAMVITVFGDEKHVVAAIEAGATGYLLKDGRADYIGDSIVQMMNGGSPISAAIARHLLKKFNLGTRESSPSPTSQTTLSQQEITVLRYLAKGFNGNDIAGLLDISHHTVSTYIKRIYRKLAVHSRGEAVYEAHKLGIIDFD